MHTVKTKSTDLEQETKGAWVPGSQRHITASKDSHDHVSGRDCQNLEAFCDLLFPFFQRQFAFFSTTPTHSAHSCVLHIQPPKD